MKAFRDPVDEWLKQTVGAEANTMITDLAKLTDQQYDFARAYVLCGSAQKAADRVKLPTKQNPNLLIHLPKIAACINILTAKREQALGKKSSAEIMERLINTSTFAGDDFDLSDDANKEREQMLKDGSKQFADLDDTSLIEQLAGSSTTANGIMQLPKVQVPAAASFGPAWIIERCVTVAERCLQIEPVFDKKGRPIGHFTFNAPGALKALEMLGKTMALFREKVEITGELSAFKEDELDERIRALVGAHPELSKIVDVEVLENDGEVFGIENQV